MKKEELQKQLTRLELKTEILQSLINLHLRFHDRTRFDISEYTELLKKKHEPDLNWLNIYQ